MSPKNTEHLFTGFPQLYRAGIHYRDLGYIGGVGFDCGDGWFRLIWRVSPQLERAAGEASIDPQSDDWPHMGQVKSKIGTLRMNLRRPTRAFAHLRDAAAKRRCRFARNAAR